MAQHDMIIADASGASVRSDLNDALAAIASTHSGTAAPATIYAGQIWVDTNTPSASVWTIYMYDGAQSIALGTLDTTNNVFLPSLNFDRLTAETAIATGDYLAIYDASAADSRKMVITDLLKIVNLLTADATPDGAADYVMTYDASAGAVKKVLLSNLVAINSLTADATPDPAADYLMTWDASAGAHKKVLIENIVSRTLAAVGTYAFCKYTADTTAHAAGFTTGGANLTYAGLKMNGASATDPTFGISSGSPGSGTWQLMGYIDGSPGCCCATAYDTAALWLRTV